MSEIERLREGLSSPRLTLADARRFGLEALSALERATAERKRLTRDYELLSEGTDDLMASCRAMVAAVRAGRDGKAVQ